MGFDTVHIVHMIHTVHTVYTVHTVFIYTVWETAKVMKQADTLCPYLLNLMGQ